MDYGLLIYLNNPFIVDFNSTPIHTVPTCAISTHGSVESNRAYDFSFTAVWLFRIFGSLFVLHVIF